MGRRRNGRFWHLADIPAPAINVRFSNRPFGVKRFQTITHSVDVARGLALLFGIGTKALPSWDSRTRWNNLLGGLAVAERQVQADIANSPHPSSARDIIHRDGMCFSVGLILYARTLHSNLLLPVEVGAIDPDAVHDDGQATARAMIAFSCRGVWRSAWPRL